MSGNVDRNWVLGANPGFELLSIEAAGFEVVRRPVVAWSITMRGHVAMSIYPVCVGFGFGGCGEMDWYAVRQPDGRVMNLGDGHYFRDLDTWAEAVRRPAAAQAWHDAGQCTVGEA